MRAQHGRAHGDDPPRALLGISLKGFCMGAADVVPGVSGGTMALILGVYQRLLDAISRFDLTLLALLARHRLRAAARHVDLRFLAALAAGIVAAIAFFTRVVSLPELLRSHPRLVYGLFFGLIVGSIVVLLRSLPRFAPRHYAALAGGAAAGFAIVTLVPVATPEASWFIVLSGALAITAMILPGISGSFILLILQKYAYVFDALGRLDLGVIVPFATGCALGLLAFSRVLSWLLARYYHVTLSAIIGLLGASLWRIWPFQERLFAVVRGKQRLIEATPVWPPGLDATAGWSLALALAGLAVVLGITWLAGARHGGA